MKTFPLCLLLVVPVWFPGQLYSVEPSKSSDERSSAYAITERGANHKIWQKVTFRANDLGRVRGVTNSYTELQTGMHYKKGEEWLEAEATIEITPTGGSASKGAHKVDFAANINTPGAIELTMPDGKQLRSHVVGLSYFDTATGKSALIADVKDSVGEILHPNRVIYEDAFSDIRADVQYTYSKAGFEQDIILREKIPSPDEYGLNPETTRLEVLTEFLNPPAPVTIARQLENRVMDETLLFGSMRIGAGKAFSLGGTNAPAQQPSGNRSGTPVQKSWTRMDGRDFLIEAIPYTSAKAAVDKLPERQAKADQKGFGSAQAKASTTRKLPVRREARVRSGKLQMASLTKPAPGYLIDYNITLDGSELFTNFTFYGDTTYYVSGEVFLYGAITLEGGTVIKFSPSEIPLLNAEDGLFDCKTDAYRPAIFTAKDDDSVGEIIDESTGIPVYYWSALEIPGGDPVLSNIRFSYGNWTLSLRGEESTMELNNVQFVKCWNAIHGYSSNIRVRNTLFANCYVPFFGIEYAYHFENVTIDSCIQLSADWSEEANSSLYFTNSIAIALTNWGHAGTIVSDHSVVTTNNMPGVFQTVGAASCYLADGSIYRNAGTTNINAGLLADLRKKTTYPPIVYSNATVTATELSPQAQRDTDLVDWGYHYAPLDYAFGGTTVDSMLTFTAGTAVGWFRTTSGYQHQGHGIHIGDSQRLTFDGTAESPNHWVRCSVVQEGGTGSWDGGEGPGGITGWATNAAASAEVQLRFTRCSMLASESCHFREDYGSGNGNSSSKAYLTVNAAHSEFSSGHLSGYSIRASYTNCLFERLNLGIFEGRTNNYLTLRNCTMRGGAVTFSRNYGVPISIRDSVFDETGFNVSDSFATNSTYTDYNYNSFLQWLPRTYPIGTNDVIVTNSFGWLTGPLGNFYQPTDSLLIDAGSLTNAGLATLYHFTTATNQVKEADSVVDIGYHYVATDNYGAPLDYDYDGTPDYLEDSNGNSSGDSGETHWQMGDDLGLRVRITHPKPSSIVP